jgi:ketosteroid isomerase-like protein
MVSRLVQRIHDRLLTLYVGKHYNQTYLWATKWDGEHITEVEEYVDFHLFANAVRENLEETGTIKEL